VRRYRTPVDIQGLLQALQLPTKDRGRNVGRDHININCPVCGDTRFHLGFHRTEGWFKCLRCGEVKGPWGDKAIQILSRASGLSFLEVYDLAQQYQAASSASTSVPQNQSAERSSFQVSGPTPEAAKVLSEYATARHLLPEDLQPLGHPLPEPVIFKNKPSFLFRLPGLVAFRGPKQPWNLYFHPQAVRSYPQPPFEGKTLVLVEGLFDAFRFPVSQVVAMLTNRPSRTLLPHLSGKKIIFWPDRDIYQNNPKSILMTISTLKALGATPVLFPWESIPPTWGKDPDELYLHLGREEFNRLRDGLLEVL